MKAEVIAIGSELLLGQSTDTNSVWISEQLAAHGVDCFYHTSVGDNKSRMLEVLTTATTRSDVVICTGGLGPTQDDITRETIAEVMGSELVADPALEEVIRAKFAARKRTMSQNNLLQAMVPKGAKAIEQMPGTAPGLVCPVEGGAVIYAMPGVPLEMKEMFHGTVLPDIAKRSPVAEIIKSRVIRTWGMTESAMAELLDPKLKSLDGLVGLESTATLAFLASGIEGLKVRITVKAPDVKSADKRLDSEEAELRDILGDCVFGTDDETMESVVLAQLEVLGETLAVAESVTGGYIAGRLCKIPGASGAFAGGVVAYSLKVKQDLLGVSSSQQVSEATAIEMAKGVREACGATVGLSTTGVAGPQELDGLPVGTVCIGVAIGDEAFATTLNMPKKREQVRLLGAISALNHLRKLLVSR